MGRRSSQIFTDKLVWVHLTAEGVVQHSLQEEISLFFSRRRRLASLVFKSVCICENLCPRFRICFEFPISIFELPSVSHRIDRTYPGPPPEVEGLYQTKGKLYNQLFEARQEGDYVDFVIFYRDSVEPWIPMVKEFIDEIKQLLDK